MKTRKLTPSLQKGAKDRAVLGGLSTYRSDGVSLQVRSGEPICKHCGKTKKEHLKEGYCDTHRWDLGVFEPKPKQVRR